MKLISLNIWGGRVMDLVEPKLQSVIAKMTDPIAKEELSKFVKRWVEDISKKDIPEILYENAEK